jgi:hypothetical protein
MEFLGLKKSAKTERPHLEPPSFAGPLTVLDVLRGGDPKRFRQSTFRALEGLIPHVEPRQAPLAIVGLVLAVGERARPLRRSLTPSRRITSWNLAPASTCSTLRPTDEVYRAG